MKVNELARLIGVTPDTVRFYTRIHILNPTKNQANGYKEYSPADVSRLRFVLSALHPIEEFALPATQVDAS